MPAQPEVLVRISRRRWRELTRELARRGQGRRESGAFLLARTHRRRSRVVASVYFDDIDPDCLNGAISMNGGAFAKLWAICSKRGMRVIADVHTHPGPEVAQSSIDAANPMVATRGHVAVILPNFAKHHAIPVHAGVHVYEGARSWRSHFGKDAARMLKRSWI